MSYAITSSTSVQVDERHEPGREARVATHLVAAVLCTVLCFAPTGVAAVVYAGQVRTMLALGEAAAARRASRAAARLCRASVSVTLGCLHVIVLGARG
jgi:hypothetical protein